MRLVLLGHSPIRGGSTDLLFQARDYFQQRHDVTTVFGEGSGAMDPRAKDSAILTPGRNWRATMREYVKLVESFRPDVAYAISGARELNLFRFLRCVRVRHASSLEQHGFVDIPFLLSTYRDYFEACTANTPDALEEVERHSKKPAYLLPYRLPAVDPAQARVTVPEQIDPTRPLEIAFVSRLDRYQKRAHWLPEIVRRAGGNFHWHIYGDGPEANGLRAKLAPLSNVTWHGWTARDELYRRLPGHDLFFLCSRWEGLPIAMVEAMRCGLACVAPDIPAGIRWTLSYGGGWLYQADSARGAAAALIAAGRDRALVLQKRREALRLSAELFSPTLADEMYPKLEQALQALKFNGHALDPATAPRLRLLPLSGYARFVSHAVQSAARSPGRFLKRALKKRRPFS